MIRVWLSNLSSSFFVRSLPLSGLRAILNALKSKIFVAYGPWKGEKVRSDFQLENKFWKPKKSKRESNKHHAMAENSRFVKSMMKVTSVLSTSWVIRRSLKADNTRNHCESKSDSSTGLISNVANAQQGTSLLQWRTRVWKEIWQVYGIL